MSNLAKTIIAGVIFILTNGMGYAQSVLGIDSLGGSFIRDIRNNNEEKIFVQTDKWFYIAGENIRFKAYCINAVSHKIFRRSKIVFADLVNEQDSVVDREILNNEYLRLEGGFSLNTFLPEGYYWLRLYTNAMLRRDKNGICVQPIYIFNPKKKLTQIQIYKEAVDNKSNSNPGQPVQVKFFPEGGSLISGTNSTIAFLALDERGKPVDVSGYVRDALDSVVTTFNTTMPGIGKFNFYVWKSRKYTAHVKWDNKEWSFDLPAVDQYASQLSIVEQTDNYFKAQVSLGDSLYQKHKLNYLLGISRDSLCFAAMGNDMFQVFIPKNKFPQGKATLVLFDEHLAVVSERAIYIDKQGINFKIQPDKEQYGPREKADLAIEVSDVNNHPLISALSLSITNDSLAKDAFGLMTNSLINDNIELPGGDLADTLSLKSDASQWDLVMLTQKALYSNWKYNDSNTASDTTFEQEDSSIANINGHIVDKKNNPLKNRIVTLISNKHTAIFETDTTDEYGRFHFPLPRYDDSTLFTMQVTNLKGVQQSDKMIIDTFIFPVVHTPFGLKRKFSTTQAAVLNHFKTYQLDTFKIGSGKEWLKAVTVKRYKKKPVDYDETKRVSQFSKVITTDQLGSGATGNIANALLMTAGVHIRQGFIIVGGGSFNIGPNSEPLIVLNGSIIDRDLLIRQWTQLMYSSPVTQYLEQFPAALIDFIEVLTGPEAGAYGLLGGNGVIIINTRARPRNFESIGLMKFYPKSYYHTAPFEQPDYTNKEIKKSPYPDQRSTIYWNGNLYTDTSGKTSVHFFTADAPATYTATVFGVTSNGALIYKKAKIKR